MSISPPTPGGEPSTGCFFYFFRQFWSDDHEKFFGKGLGYFLILWQLICSQLKNLGGSKNISLKNSVFWPKWPSSTVLKKSDWLRVSKKCLQNECELHRCSKCISIMFLWCFGLHWYFLLMVKTIFLFTNNSFVKATFEAFLQFSAEIDTLF